MVKKIEAFHYGCLWKICHIFWPNEISDATRLNTIVRCLRSNVDVSDDLDGHVFRMDQHRIAKIALRRSPPGKRKRGKPKTTWRWTVMAEMADLGLRPNVESNRHILRPTGDEEN